MGSFLSLKQYPHLREHILSPQDQPALSKTQMFDFGASSAAQLLPPFRASVSSVEKLASSQL